MAELSRTPVKRLAPDGAGLAAGIARLLNQELGAGLYLPEHLLRDAADPTAVVFAAGSRALTGAAVARLLVPEDATYYERFGTEAISLFSGLVGSLEALAVDPGVRRRGLGAQLTRACVDWMRGQGCDAAVTLSWLSGSGSSSASLFRRLGFREGRTIERFYFEESVRDGWSCPVCRGPCTCSAAIYTLALGA